MRNMSYYIMGATFQQTATTTTAETNPIIILKPHTTEMTDK